MSHVLTLTIPDDLYQHLATTAATTKRPLSEIAIHSLKTGSPPTLEHIPQRYHTDLQALATFDDNLLWEIAQAQFSAEHFVQIEALLHKQANGQLSPQEEAQLATLQEESNSLMIRRAYVYALLKWRGNPVPQLA